MRMGSLEIAEQISRSLTRMVKTRRMKRLRKATRKSKRTRQKGGNMDLRTVEVKTRKSNGDYVSLDDVATVSSA